MKNSVIAFNWVTQQIKKDQLIISEGFFTPMNEKQRIRLRAKLNKAGYYVWSMNNENCNGALIVKKTSPHLEVATQAGFVMGFYCINNTRTLLGEYHFADLIGRM